LQKIKKFPLQIYPEREFFSVVWVFLSLRASSQTGVAIRFSISFHTDSHDSDIGHCLGMTVFSEPDSGVEHVS